MLDFNKLCLKIVAQSLLARTPASRVSFYLEQQSFYVNYIRKVVQPRGRCQLTKPQCAMHDAAAIAFGDAWGIHNESGETRVVDDGIAIGQLALDKGYDYRSGRIAVTLPV
jgi:hypothetical protein